IIVVLTSRWPSSSWTVRMSWRSSSRCVANECRSVCGLARLATPTCRTASFRARLQDRLVQVMPAALAGEPVHIHPRGGEYPLPGPLPPGVRILSRQSARQEHGTDLLASQDDGQTLRTLRAHDALEPGQVQLEHVAVEKQEGA